MKLLAVETSTDACSAALYIDGEIQEKFAVVPQQHTRLILPMIDELMANAGLAPGQLDALGLSRGPGSFTGVRIATGVVHGIACGADLPVVPVSTLAALAQDFFNERADADCAFVAQDARMNEIFWGVYYRAAQGRVQLAGVEIVTAARGVDCPQQAGFGVGSGWAVYHDDLTTCLDKGRIMGVDSLRWPRAAAIAQLAAYDFAEGSAVAAEQALPVYLRDKVAKKESER